MRRRRALSLACVAGIAACSGYASTNGGDAPDAGEAPDASESSTPPPAPAMDACVDGPWCLLHAPDATVCDDFDEPGTFSGKWSDTSAYHATLEVAADPAAPSSPRILAITTDGTAQDVSVAELLWKQPTPVTTIAYGFSVRIERDADGGAPDLALFQLVVAGAAGTGFLTFHQTPGTSGLNHFSEYPDGGTIYGRTIPLPAIDDGKWHDVVVHLSLVAPRAITVSIDGATPKDDVLGEGFDTGPYQMHAAVTFATVGNDGWKLAFDDVWLEGH